MGSIPKTMKALVAYGNGNYVLEPEYPTPVCDPDSVIIKTAGCGICASDAKCMHGAAMYWGTENQPMWVQPPFIPGHEFYGTIVELGSNVKGFELGDCVVPEQIIPCWSCRYCKTGKYWMCEPHKIFGFLNDCNGGMAEYVRLPGNAVYHKIPNDMPADQALLIEPYGCSKHCIDRAQIGSEDVVVLSGSGTLGLGMITYARSRNPQLLIVLDMIDGRLEKAKEFGADIVLNPSKTDVVAEVKALTEGYGCDIYIEATGHPSSVTQGMQMIRKLGRFIEFSVFGEETTLDWSVIGDKKELDVLGSHLSPYTYPYVIKNIYNGSLKTDGVVTKMFAVEEWEKAFDYASGKHGDIKVAISF